MADALVSSKGVRLKKGKGTSNPRLLAAKALSFWLSKGPGARPEIQRLGDTLLKGKRLQEKDRALFWHILVGSVRWLRLIRWHLERYIKRYSRLPVEVQAILLTGGFQIIFLSRIPFFSAVDESVKLTRIMGAPWASGLVNASLRRLATSKKIVPSTRKELLERCKGSKANCLSNLTSHPHWMVKRWLKAWGVDGCVSICLQNNIQPPLTVRVNTLKIERDSFLDMLKKGGLSAEKTSLSPCGIRLEGFRGRVEEIPGFEQGLFQVQDEAAQLVSLLLDLRKGQRVLDVCAGVGGKSTHIAELMEDRGNILACDTNRSRLQILAENSKRLGITSIRTCLLPKPEKGRIQKRPFDRIIPCDRILIDAPCSGLGVIRRHPDIKWNRTPDDIEALAARQLSLLEKWASCLKREGMLVYSVCTMEYEETEGVIQSFLETHSDFALVSAREVLPFLPDDLVKGGFFRSLPGQYGMDGFFSAVIRRL